MNAAGQSVRPTQEAEMEALASIDLGPDLIGRNPEPAKGYPIVTLSWVVFYRSGNANRLDILRKVFDYILSDETQAVAPELGFVSLPPRMREKGRVALSKLQK
jgi:phosphate transport system substrate-binding protein